MFVGTRVKSMLKSSPFGSCFRSYCAMYSLDNFFPMPLSNVQNAWVLSDLKIELIITLFSDSFSTAATTTAKTTATTT